MIFSLKYFSSPPEFYIDPILLGTDENQEKENRSTNEVLSKVLRISMKKIDRVKKRFVEDGLEIALTGHPKEIEYEKKL